MSESLDWSKLPAGLEWLAELAERYGHLQFDDPIYAFLRGATPKEREELRKLIERWNAFHPQIEAWLDEYNITKHTEARLVYFTGHMLGTGVDSGLL
jgi:hypothetical protein